MNVDPGALARLRARHPEAVAEAAARRVRRPLLADEPGGRDVPDGRDEPDETDEPDGRDEPDEVGGGESDGHGEPGRSCDARRTKDRDGARGGDATGDQGPARDRLLIIAADHPARGVLSVGDRPTALADRADLLERLCLALSRPGVDGVLASADILDDLLLLGVLDHKIVMGSMNRGGLLGARFELDDRFTGHRPEDLTRLRFDAGKLLLRLDLEDPGSLATLHTAARTVDEMAARRLPVFVEPFLCHRGHDGMLRTDLSATGVATSVAVASGLGGTSAYTWLKVPVTEHPDDMAEALAASTLPAVILGGDVGEGPAGQEAAYEKWRGALRLPTVQGLVVGRSLLCPADGDVAAAVDVAAGLL